MPLAIMSWQKKQMARVIYCTFAEVLDVYLKHKFIELVKC